MEVEVRVRGERHAAPAAAWVAVLVVCGLGDALLGGWVLLPLFIAGFYGGMVVIDLLTYPMLSFWRAWLRRHGLRAWYLVEVVGMWGGTTLILLLLAPWWLGWRWGGVLPLQVVGGVLFVLSVAVGAWACFKMGWARLLFAGALFLPGAGAEENRVPQRLVLEGPYRYVRNPLYVTDFLLILGTALLASNWFLVLLATLYLLQLALQLPLEERELRRRPVPSLLPARAPLLPEAPARPAAESRRLNPVDVWSVELSARSSRPTNKSYRPTRRI